MLALIVALLGACSSDDAPRVLRTPDAAVLVAAPADGGDDAMVSGEVTVVDGCLGINDDVAVWPSGTQVTDPDGPVIEVPQLGTITVGDHVEGAGGYMRARDLHDEHSPAVPDSCIEAGLVVYRPE